MFIRGFLYLFVLILPAVTLQAAEIIPVSPQYNVSLKNVDERGGVQPLTWPTRGEWIWDDPTTEIPYFHPKFRLWILVPKTEKLLFAQSSVNQILRGLAHNPPLGEGELLALDSEGPEISARIRWEDASHHTVNGIILGKLLAPPKPLLFVHSSCLTRNLAVSVSSKFASYLYLGVSCADAPSDSEHGSFVMVFHRSMDAAWLGEPGHTTRLSPIAPAIAPAQLPLFKAYLVKPIDPNAPVGYNVVASQDMKSASSDEGKTIYAVYENTFAPIFNGNFELSSTYLNYQEPSSKTTVSQIALTGKFGLSYHLLPKKLDLGVSAFMNLLPVVVSSSPANLPASRFFGVNGRVGYFLPLQIPNTRLLVMGGWYMWGMLVPPAANGNPPYGIQYLSGPQLFVVGQFNFPNLNPFRTYLKFASVSSSVGAFSFLNSEIAAGGAYTLGTRLPGFFGRVMRRFYVSVDFSHAQYASTDLGADGTPVNSMSLDTISTGFGFEF